MDMNQEIGAWSEFSPRWPTAFWAALTRRMNQWPLTPRLPTGASSTGWITVRRSGAQEPRSLSGASGRHRRSRAAPTLARARAL